MFHLLLISAAIKSRTLAARTRVRLHLPFVVVDADVAIGELVIAAVVGVVTVVVVAVVDLHCLFVTHTSSAVSTHTHTHCTNTHTCIHGTTVLASRMHKELRYDVWRFSFLPTHGINGGSYVCVWCAYCVAFGCVRYDHDDEDDDGDDDGDD